MPPILSWVSITCGTTWPQISVRWCSVSFSTRYHEVDSILIDEPDASNHFRTGRAAPGEVSTGCQVAQALQRAAELGKDGIDPEGDMKLMRSNAAAPHR